MTPEETFIQLLGCGIVSTAVEARLAAISAIFMVKLEETGGVCLPVTCHDYVEPWQWQDLNAFNKERVIVCALAR
jgi:hypothetical protein